MTQLGKGAIDQRDTPTRHEQESVPPADSAAVLAGILDGYMADLHAGKSPDRNGLLSAHPALASQLEACLAGIDFVHQAAGSAALKPATLGEFQILRELGRGGMGVVYEAEQTSLHRKVALKVLRFGAVADVEAMQRFRREAETVARLHHTNIVPIFAVGCERGVHYYAMQFIEGRSLADVLADSRRTGSLPSPQTVAGWGLQAAEALAHAHQRGVIHRDIKPSNLLLDPEGVVWLTDFGLAKRVDEATLTMSGALMGTPRYMSPEQAESMKRPVDHRTDLYSLGATLYELATGRPVFESATPHGIIERILNEQPARPRQIRPELPRDLETIILACLAKDPSQRYQTAHALAGDLRAVLDGRAIQARRIPFRERMTRYVRKRKKAISQSSLVIAATALLIVGSFLGWRLYRDARLGRVLLSTDGPSLTAQVLSESGEEPIGEPFAVGTRTVAALPAARYRLRVEGPGVLSQTYYFAVGRGELGTYRLAAPENRLLGQEPIPYAFASDALMLSPRKADFVEWKGLTLLRRDGASGKPIWDASRPVKPWEPEHDPVAWMRRLSYLGDETRPGTLVQPAPDLDGDGTADIIWTFRVTPSLLALSGKDGSMLWTYTAQSDGPGGPDRHGPAWPQSVEHVPRQGRVLGSPSLRDVDGDGVADLIAAFVQFEDGPPVLRPPGPNPNSATIESDEWAHRGRRVVAAVSGRSGRALWSHPIDRTTTTLLKHSFDRGAILIGGRGASKVAFAADAQWIGLDLSSGKPRGQPIDLGFVPVRPVQYVDLDGDGEPEVLALGPGPSPNQQTLVVFSSRTGRQTWSQTIRAQYESPLINPPPNWPVVSDLDGDGRPEIVVADSGPIGKGDDYRGVRLLEGASGAERWVRPLHPKGPIFAPFAMFQDGLAQVIDTPDIDGDGTRDLVAVSRFDGKHPFAAQEPLSLYADAISGKDGHSLWWWHSDVSVGFWGPSILIWPPFLWGRAEDGWPMLAVPLGGTKPTADGQSHPDPHREPPRVHFLSLADGRELHAIDGLSWPKPADLDGDGLADLWGSVDGRLQAYHGETPEVWRALGRCQKAGDLDGDGIADVLSADLQIRPDIDEESRKTLTAVAHSGGDGRILWRSRLDFQGPWSEQFVEGEPGYTLSTFPLPGGDFDGDGTLDVIVTWSRAFNNYIRTPAALPLEVLSGRSGRPLWPAVPLALGFEATGYSEITSSDLRACEPREPMDLIVRHQSPFAPPTSARSVMSSQQDRLARVSGRDGHVIWDVLLMDRKGGTLTDVPTRTHEFGDFDGDGGLDVVVLLQTDGLPEPGFEWCAVSLRDGKTLWSHAAPFHPKAYPVVTVGDLDGDGRPEIVVRDQLFGNAQGQVAVTVLDGRDGRERWTWRGGGFSDAINPDPRDVCLAELEAKGARDVCVNVRISDLRQRVVVLDATGRERAGRELKGVSASTLTPADLDGDGHDELLFQDDDRLRAVRRNLQDLWTWPTRESVREVIPAREGQPAVVVLGSMVGLDGATGRPRWAGHGSTVVLDPGNSRQPPRLLSESDDATVCRLALPTTPEGIYQQSHGTPSAHRFASDDPRWARPLPWGSPNGPIWPGLLYQTGGLALINVVVPLAVLRLATRRRIWGMRLLLALPVVVAIPMAVSQMFRYLTPVQLSASTLVGIPVLEYAGAALRSILDRRWKRLAVRVGLTALATVAIGIVWLWSDMRAMPATEHYTWSGWYLVAIPGAYLVGVLACIMWIARGGFRLMRGLARRAAAASVASERWGRDSTRLGQKLRPE